MGKWLMFIRDVDAIYSQYVFQHPIQMTVRIPNTMERAVIAGDVSESVSGCEEGRATENRQDIN
tara:strand:- start:957 stop:1148 length:192 start_codon:yes stop_codon:yes gene_type:complete